MTVCSDCNKEFKVEVVDLGMTIPSDELDLDIGYCPFCGYDVDYMDNDVDL
jgi:hypothetical protein